MKIVNLSKREDIAEIIGFINDNGREAFNHIDDDELYEYLKYFLSIRKLFILRDKKKRILGIAVGVHIKSPEFIAKETFPVDTADGRILYINGIIIHKRIRHRNIMSTMLLKWLHIYPHLEYIMFKRYNKSNEIKVIDVRTILQRR